MSKLAVYLKDESASTLAEYAMIIAIVGIGVATQALALGQAISGRFGATATSITEP